VNIGVETLK